MIKSKDLKQLDLAKELVLTDAINLPVTSLLLKNKQIVTSTHMSWDYKHQHHIKHIEQIS